MNWIKKGLIFDPVGKVSWAHAYAWVPTVDMLGEDVCKVYFAGRSSENLSQIGWFVIDLKSPSKILEVSEHPVLALGSLGAFDDSAVLPSWIVNYDGQKYLYYVGWMQGKRVPYYASIGLAISGDGGATFKRVSCGPLIERDDIDPYMTASLCVRIENGTWRMWYTSNTQWCLENGKPKPRYLIKYAESFDGIKWQRKGIVCIDFKSEDEYRITRPCILYEAGVYKMWYSYGGEAYRVGYAESLDGIHWQRRDDLVGIEVSESGWDSDMIEYAYVFEHKGKKHMFYNGNDYGRTGIGYAISE